VISSGNGGGDGGGKCWTMMAEVVKQWIEGFGDNACKKKVQIFF